MLDKNRGARAPESSSNTGVWRKVPSGRPISKHPPPKSLHEEVAENDFMYFRRRKPHVRKQNSPPAILGPEMAAPILWAPGSFCWQPPRPIKFFFVGTGLVGFWGEG